MKKNLMGVAAAVLAMSMSMPAFAHEVTVKGGTNNTPEPTVEHEENLHGFNDVDKKDNATVNKVVDKNAVVGVGNNKLEGDEIITIGGIVGKVVTIREEDLIIETGADRNKMKIQRWAVNTNVTKTEQHKKEVEKAREAAKEKKEAKKSGKKSDK